MKRRSLCLVLAVAMAGVPVAPAAAQWVTTYEQAWPVHSSTDAFRRLFPAADGLFNAFDYGHAILYEILWTSPNAPVAKLEIERFDYLTKELLIRTPRFALEEHAIEPEYARLVPQAKLMFDWAHALHRQLYDILADERLNDDARSARAAEAVRYYRSRPDLAFSSVPKSMSLMEQQSYSLAFKKSYPKFNGLIWAYHWLQMGVYEPLVLNPPGAARRQGVAAAITHFRRYLANPPASFPASMPMGPATAPEFSKRYQEAAIIFDNLHSMHDVISDILANPLVPREQKRAEILRAAARFRDDTTEVMTVAEWRAMGTTMAMPGMEGMDHSKHLATMNAAASDSAFAKVQERGKVVMGVDQYLSKHVFEDVADGGRIVLTTAPTDTAGTRTIRAHMRTISVAFARGDFDLPGQVHAQEVPGTKVMTARRAMIEYTVEDRAGGSAVRIRTTDPAALAAVREFLLFQRTDHRTP